MADVSTAVADVEVTIGYLEQQVRRPPTLSNLDSIPGDEGLAGAQAALMDNSTTGKFTGHQYRLVTEVVKDGDDFEAAARDLLGKTSLIIVNAPAAQLLELADLPEAADAVLFNASSRQVLLRGDLCRPNVLHTIPSYAMLADALAQFSVKKRWADWALITGTGDDDRAFAEALRRSAIKFHVNIRVEKEWAYDADMRRSASSEVPLFTQDFPDYDLLVVADEQHDFGRYVMYNTWIPRPLAGSEGVVPAAWSSSVEQYGAAQLQSRFQSLAGRTMRPIDYAAWAGVRAIGEAVTRTGSADAATIRSYLLSADFELAGFKGHPLTFRRWNGQLRQPVPLSHPRAVVANAPLEGFLHQRNELDTLGIDQAESGCMAFGE